MCGIFGFFDNKQMLTTGQANRLSRALALQAQSRGSDASGYAVLADGQIRVTKKATPARQLTFDTLGSKILIGHTRYATMGDPCSDNQAHPFLSRDSELALTHNGVAHFEFKRLAEEFRLSALIDSEGMLRYIEMFGANKNGLMKFFRDWDGSGYAIAMLNSKDQSLILFRNEINPLIVAETMCGILVYGSTKSIIVSGCLSADLTIRNFLSITPGVRYEFFLDGRVDVSEVGPTLYEQKTGS